MTVQIISRDGQPEYAVLPWADYQALLHAAGHAPQTLPDANDTPVQARRAPMSELQALREGKGLSVEALARSVGISPHYLTMIERGEREPDAAIQRALAWNFGLEGWS